MNTVFKGCKKMKRENDCENKVKNLLFMGALVKWKCPIGVKF